LKYLDKEIALGSEMRLLKRKVLIPLLEYALELKK
jgi:hypothetical protein